MSERPGRRVEHLWIYSSEIPMIAHVGFKVAKRWDKD
jgi:hypothetical protein